MSRRWMHLGYISSLDIPDCLRIANRVPVFNPLHFKGTRDNPDIFHGQKEEKAVRVPKKGFGR